jgi:hypothetical protein
VAYRNRRGFWGINVMARVDARCRFLFISQKCTGSTHDSLAWDCTSVSRAVRHDKRLRHDSYVVGDEAFVCEDQVLTP